MPHDLLSAVEDSLVNLDELASAFLLLKIALDCLEDEPDDLNERVRVLIQAARSRLDGALDDLPYRLKLVKQELTKPHLPGCSCRPIDD